MSSPTSRRRSGNGKLSHWGTALAAALGTSRASCVPVVGSSLDAPFGSGPPLDICTPCGLIVRPSVRRLPLPQAPHEGGERTHPLQAER
jgi:hypothetical protein